MAVRMPDFPVVASMQITGDLSVRYLFGCSKGLQNKIAQAILGDEDVSKEPQEVLDDTVMEFVNVVCGNIVAKAVQMGKKTDIYPPELLHGNTGGAVKDADEICLLFPLFLPDGEKGALGLIISK